MIHAWMRPFWDCVLARAIDASWEDLVHPLVREGPPTVSIKWTRLPRDRAHDEHCVRSTFGEKGIFGYSSRLIINLVDSRSQVVVQGWKTALWIKTPFEAEAEADKADIRRLWSPVDHCWKHEPIISPRLRDSLPLDRVSMRTRA